MDEQVVELAAAQSVGDVFKEGAGHGLVHGVEKNGLFVQQQIGVVGYAVGHAVDALKAGKTPVVGADPEKVVKDLFGAVHVFSSFYFWGFVSFVVIVYHIFLKLCGKGDSTVL
jgi:hypothetical protein